MGISRGFMAKSAIVKLKGWFAGVPLQVKLFVGFGLIVVLFTAVVVTACNGIIETQASVKALYEENFANVSDLPALRSNLNAERLAVAMMLESKRSEWGVWLNELKQRTEKDYEIINRLILRIRKYPEESGKLGEFISIRDAYQKTQDDQLRQLIDYGKREEVKSAFLGIQESRHAQMRAILQELEGTELSEAQAMVKHTEEVSKARISTFILFGSIAILFTLFLAGFMSRSVSSYVYKLKLEETAVARANRSLRMTNACNNIVIHATEEAQLLNDICRLIVEVGGYRLAWVGYAQDDNEKSVRPIALAGTDGDYVNHAKISWADNERGRGPTGTVIRTGRPIIVRDTRTEPDYDPWRYQALEKGYRSSATMPLGDTERVYGALMIYSNAPDAFDEEEAHLLEELADDLAYATTTLRTRAARAEAEKKARGASLYARSLLEASLDPLVTISPTGKITDVNAATEKVTGRTRVELAGTDFSDYFTEPEKARAGYKEALSHGFVRDYRLTVQHASGCTTDVLYNAAVYRNEAGEIQGVFAAARDITSRTLAGRERGGNYNGD